MRKAKYISVILIGLLLLSVPVDASAWRVTASATTVTPGSAVRIGVAGLPNVAGQFHFSTSNGTVLSGGSDNWIDGNSGHLGNFTARSVGTATVTVRATDVSHNNPNATPFTGSRTITIRVVERTNPPAQNNNANNNQTETDTNRAEAPIEVTPERDPVIVIINDQEFTVLRSVGELEIPNGFEETEITINDETVPGFHNEELGLTLVALTSEEGIIGLYIFNEENDSFFPFIPIDVGFRLLLLDFPEALIPEGYEPFTVEIDGAERTVYKLNESDEFALVYGINAETGEAGIYIYDIKEETLQRFIPAEEESNKFIWEENIPLLALAGLSGILFITNFATIISSSRKLKRLRNKTINH